MWVVVNVSEEDAVSSLTGYFTFLTPMTRTGNPETGTGSHGSCRDRMITTMNINTLGGFTLSRLWNSLISILKERRHIL